MQSEEDFQPDDTGMSSLAHLARRVLKETTGSHPALQLPEAGRELAASVLMAESYRGPILHPVLLKKLDDVVVDGAERAFAMTEREQAHRHHWDSELAAAEVRRRDAETKDQLSLTVDRRIVFVGCLTFLFVSLGLAFWAAMAEKLSGLFVAGLGALVSVVGGAFVIRTTRRQTDAAEGHSS